MNVPISCHAGFISEKAKLKIMIPFIHTATHPCKPYTEKHMYNTHTHSKHINTGGFQLLYRKHPHAHRAPSHKIHTQKTYRCTDTEYIATKYVSCVSIFTPHR